MRYKEVRVYFKRRLYSLIVNCSNTTLTIPQDKLEKSEQELWEESQTAKASHNSKKKNDGNEYELVFEDVIEFVNTEKKKAKNKKGEGEKNAYLKKQ